MHWSVGHRTLLHPTTVGVALQPHPTTVGYSIGLTCSQNPSAGLGDLTADVLAAL